MDYQKRVRISQKNLPSEVTHMKRRAKRKISLPAVIVSVLHSETSSVVRLYARPSKHHGTKPQDHHCSFSYLRKGFAAFHFHTYASRLFDRASVKLCDDHVNMLNSNKQVFLFNTENV